MLRQGPGEPVKALGPHKFPPPLVRRFSGTTTREAGSGGRLHRGSGTYGVVLRPRRGGSLASSPQKRFGRSLLCSYRGPRGTGSGNLEQQPEEDKQLFGALGLTIKLQEITFPDCRGDNLGRGGVMLRPCCTPVPCAHAGRPVARSRESSLATTVIDNYVCQILLWESVTYGRVFPSSLYYELRH